MFQPRVYRDQMNIKHLNKYHLNIDESDLLIFTNKLDEKRAKEYLKKYRDEIKSAIKIEPKFINSLTPIENNTKFPKIVKDMVCATKYFNVGPMASVAGAIALYMGRYLKKSNEEVIIENGGDLYIYTKNKRYINIYTEDEIFKDKLTILINDQEEVALCTSSKKLGHSISLGNSDAVVIKAKNAIYADAAATAYANKVKSKIDIEKVLLQARKDKYIKGIIIIIDGNLGVWGDIEFKERD